MTPKKHKSKKSPSVDHVVSRRGRQWPWSELPRTNSSISHTLETNIWLNNRNSAPGITKSWLTPSTRCDAHHHRRPQLRHITTAAYNPNPRRPYNHYLGEASIAEAAYEMPHASHWCLLKSDTNARSHPPPMIPSNRFNLLGPELQLNGVHVPNSPCSGLAVDFTVYRNVTRSSYWSRQISIRHECATADPFDAKGKPMEITSAVAHSEGKFYATSLQGAVAVMQVVGTRLTITAVGGARAVPDCSSSRFFKEYLFEMNGEIWLVFLIHERSVAVVDGVEVFRLDLDRLDWVRIERLRGKTVFLKERCVWVDSEEFGCRDDRVYFTEGLDNSWRVYDMESCCISPGSFGWS